MPITRISRNDTGASHNIQIDAGQDGSIVVRSTQGGRWLTRTDESGATTLLANAPAYGDFAYGAVETLSDGRYVVHTSYYNGARLQILNANGTAATGVINPMVEGQDRSAQGYAVTATQSGGFALIFNDTSRASDSFTGTNAPNPYNGGASFTANAGTDVRLRYFDDAGLAEGASTVADDDVETVNGATISRRAYDQYVTDSETLTDGRTAFVFMDNRLAGNPDYGSNMEWQLSLQIASPGNIGEPIKVDVRPFDYDRYGQERPDSLDPGVAAPNVISLPDGTLAVIWTERTHVPADVPGGWATTGTQTVIRYFNNAGEALTGAIPLVTRGTDHGNHTSYVWGEALPDGRIAIAYNVGVYGVNGNGTLNAFVGVVGPLGSSVQSSQVNAAAQNGQFYTIQDLAVRTDGTLDLVFNDASLGSNGFNRNVTVIDRLAVTGSGETSRVGTAAANNFAGTGEAETMFGQGGKDSLSGFGGNDGLHGGNGNDTLLGGTGDDRLFGDDGDDILNGGTAADRMEGGLGNDNYYVDSLLDTLIEAPGGGIDTVRSTISYALAAEFENLALLGSAAKGVGNAAANVMSGSDAVNTLEGGIGNDTLRGNGGADKLLGGADNDLLYGGVAGDTLDGGAGNDKLYGGSGPDTLTGGTGIDRFHFDAPLSRTTNVDKILDFSPVDDAIYLDRAIFGGITANGRLAVGAFQKGTAAADAADRIIYDQAAGKIYYDADGNGSGAQILFATVTPGTALTNADFVGYV
ncbi:MAG TPA: calcium-binding protein [Allosphingosinicella sp.]|jgi:Ca2+-binding RTX toxin-like protein